jgi:hypothetical protein
MQIANKTAQLLKQHTGTLDPAAIEHHFAMDEHAEEQEPTDDTLLRQQLEEQGHNVLPEDLFNQYADATRSQDKLEKPELPRLDKVMSKMQSR